MPVIDDRYLTRFFNEAMTTIDTSRGCPFTCSYCSVKNVMGRTMRSREPDAVVHWVRDAMPLPRHRIAVPGRRRLLPQPALGRNPDRPGRGQEGVPAALLHDAGRRRRVVLRQRRAGRDRDAPSIGAASASSNWRRRPDATRRSSESSRSIPDNLNFATKYQNTDDRQHRMKIEESRARVIDKYRRVVDNWHRVGVSVHAGYMLGFPSTAPIADESRPRRCASSASTSCRSSS